MEFSIDKDKHDIENSDTESMEFFIDTVGNEYSCDSQIKTNSANPFLEELFKDFDFPLQEKKSEQKTESENVLVTKVLASLGVNKDGTLRYKKSYLKKGLNPIRQKDVKEALAKSVLTPEFEKLHLVPPIDLSNKKLKQQRKKERDLTKGNKWYGLPATELTDAAKRDLEVLQMRSVLDPKHFYKKNDLKVLPKYFQIGKVMDSPLDFYNNRIPKKMRKKTLVDELLADAEFSKYNKRKYKEIMQEKQTTHYKAWRQAKRLKKQK